VFPSTQFQAQISLKCLLVLDLQGFGIYSRRHARMHHASSLLMKLMLLGDNVGAVVLEGTTNGRTR